MLSGMDEKSLQRKIDKVKGEIAGLGPLRPGTLYKRGSVCGKPGCRCTRERRPIRHGPYHYLSYTFGGKSHTEFVRADEVAAAREAIGNYNRLMKLVKVLVDCSIKLARLRKGR
jgi:hypothetical protein